MQSPARAVFQPYRETLARARAREVTANSSSASHVPHEGGELARTQRAHAIGLVRGTRAVSDMANLRTVAREAAKKRLDEGGDPKAQRRALALAFRIFRRVSTDPVLRIALDNDKLDREAVKKHMRALVSLMWDCVLKPGARTDKEMLAEVDKHVRKVTNMVPLVRRAATAATRNPVAMYAGVLAVMAISWMFLQTYGGLVFNLVVSNDPFGIAINLYDLIGWMVYAIPAEYLLAGPRYIGERAFLRNVVFPTDGLKALMTAFPVSADFADRVKAANSTLPPSLQGTGRHDMLYVTIDPEVIPKPTYLLASTSANELHETYKTFWKNVFDQHLWNMGPQQDAWQLIHEHAPKRYDQRKAWMIVAILVVALIVVLYASHRQARIAEEKSNKARFVKDLGPAYESTARNLLLE